MEEKGAGKLVGRSESNSVKNMAKKVERTIQFSEETKWSRPQSRELSVKERMRAFNDMDVQTETLTVNDKELITKGVSTLAIPIALESQFGKPNGVFPCSEDESTRSYDSSEGGHPVMPSIERAVKRFESSESLTMEREYSDRPVLPEGAKGIMSRMQLFAKSESILAKDERDRVQRVKEKAKMSNFNKDELEKRKAAFVGSDSMARRSGKHKPATKDSQSNIDDTYYDFQRLLSQHSINNSMRATRMSTALQSSLEDSLDFTSIADIVLDEDEESDLRTSMSRRKSTVGAGMHEYAFATSKHVAENLNQTSLRLSFEIDDSINVNQSFRSVSTLQHLCAQLEDERTPLYFTLSALMSSINRSETCPLVVEVSKLEHPYEGISNQSCFLALVFHKASRHESALFVIEPPTEEDSKLSLRFVVPIWGKLSIRMSGDGHLILTNYTTEETFTFHMPSLQSMWSAMNALNNYIEAATRKNYFPGGSTHEWLEFYDLFLQDSSLHADGSIDMGGNLVKIPSMVMKLVPEEEEANRQIMITELEDVEREATIIKAMRVILGSFRDDLDNVTFTMMYDELEKYFKMNVKQMFKPFIDEKLIMVLGQMESASEIFDDFLYLGTEWNASNKEELEERGCEYILNMTHEIDIFFPGHFNYCRRKLFDTPENNIFVHLDPAVEFISLANTNNSRILVHCQMGVSRSASAVIAYAMRTYGWSLDEAYNYIKMKRAVVKPNKGFWVQLQEYEQKLQEKWSEFGTPEFQASPSDFIRN